MISDLICRAGTVMGRELTGREDGGDSDRHD